ncbi:hypothetical protein I6F11_06065 [Ensifer sp. NBAIM29]|nr:hypothetical protein [Ensifer sp. NBAIM29]
MTFRDTWKRVNWLWVAGFVTLAYAGWIIWVLGWSRICDFFQGPDTDLNAVGDFLAGTFAPVALIWLCAAVFTQRQELNDTRDQFTESKRVTDEQLKVIHSQNALLSLQHNQAVENAKQAYRLSLFDKRFQIYEKFIKFGEDHKENDYDDVSYGAMINLSQEAAFVFDNEIEDWFTEIAEQIESYMRYKVDNPLQTRPSTIIAGYQEALDNKHNKLIYAGIAKLRDSISEQFTPEVRIGKFWGFLSVSDQPYIFG